MPNNASARRDKEKKNKKDKDKKRKGNEKTDTPPLLKEDTASADSRTFSLSLPLEEQEEQALSLALVRMEKAMQQHATGEAEEPDWINAEWAWARTALRKEHANSLTMDERTILRQRLRVEIQDSNPLISRAELISQLEVATLRTALDWRRSIRRDGKDSSAVSREATAKSTLDELRMDTNRHTTWSPGSLTPYSIVLGP